jgi:hypothetical protein
MYLKLRANFICACGYGYGYSNHSVAMGVGIGVTTGEVYRLARSTPRQSITKNEKGRAVGSAGGS